MPEKTVMTNFQVGLIFVLGIFALIGKQILAKIIDKFFKETIDAEYVTASRFDSHQKECSEHRKMIKIETDARFDKVDLRIEKFFEVLLVKIEDVGEDIGISNGLTLIAITNNDNIPKEEKNKAILSLASKNKRKDNG